MDVPVHTEFRICNANFLTAEFEWRQISGDDYDVMFRPARGTLGANETKVIGLTFVARRPMVSDLPCNIRREGGQSLVIGGPSLVILEGKACNPL